MEEVVGSVGSGLVGLHLTGKLLGTSVALLRTGSLGGTVSPWSLRPQMSGHQEYSEQANTVNVGTDTQYTVSGRCHSCLFQH